MYKLAKLLNRMDDNSNIIVCMDGKRDNDYRGSARKVPFELSQLPIIAVETQDGELCVTVAEV